jgi:hypothetical protein
MSWHDTSTSLIADTTFLLNIVLIAPPLAQNLSMFANLLAIILILSSLALWVFQLRTGRWGA